jgi:hypothetical protein
MDVEVLVDVQKTYIFLECLVISTIPLSPSSEYDDLLCRDEKNIRNVSNLPKRRNKNVNFSEIISCEKKQMIQQDNLRQDVVSYFKHKEDYFYYLSNFSLQLQRRAACGYMDTESPAGISKDQRKKIIKWQFEVGHRLAMSSEEIMAALCLFEFCSPKT